jgi:heme O synthase-like polyprenyltransferase
VATKPVSIISTLPTAPWSRRPAPAVSRLPAVSDYWALTKPEVNFLIAIATLTGSYLAIRGQLVHFRGCFSFTLFWVRCWSPAAPVR